jgi:membrane protease subunit HflK
LRDSLLRNQDEKHMPWSNQSGGGGNNGPWGPRPGGPGGGGQQPDLEDILRKSQDKLRQAMPGGGGGWLLPGVLAALVAVVIGFFGFFVRVNTDEVGIVLRFGEYVRQLPPGLHVRLPYPVEEVLLPKVTRANRIEIGMRTAQGANLSPRDVPEESLMLTGDENIVDIDFVVVWKINDAPDYLFNIQNPEGTVKDVSESAMREIVGQSDIEPILTAARAETEGKVEELIQRTLDGYKAGIEITQVQLQKVDPPAQVIDAFRDVQAARADEERLQNEAQAYANRVVPEARGEAERILQQAQGYRDRVIAEASGEAERFEKVLQEYEKAPDVTRQRIFIDTMKEVMSKTDKIIIDNDGGGVVPYLPLPELQKRQPTASSAPSAVPASPSLQTGGQQ